MSRPFLFDTTALIAAIREPQRLAGFRRAAGSQRYFLTAIAIAELQAGARTAQQAALIEQLARLFASDDRLLAPTAHEWSAAGRVIARAIGQRGAMEPRDHYPDALIAQLAGRIGAAVITSNVSDIRDWIVLGRLDATAAEANR